MNKAVAHNKIKKPKGARIQKRKLSRHPKRKLISADGKPYSKWQRRTRTLCIILLVYALLEIASGIVFVCLGQFAQFYLSDVAGGLSITLDTLIFGCYNLIMALLGLHGAKNPKKIGIFFWAVLIDAVLMSWQVASDISVGHLEISSSITFAICMAFAVCAWNVRGQTGYFDNHPMPENENTTK